MSRLPSPATGWVAALVLVAVAVVAWWVSPPDPARELGRHASPLARLERLPAPRLGAGIERWRAISSSGDTAMGLWRPAARGGGATWTVVMLGGLDTGERAALLLPPGLPVNALAMDWPWSGPRTLTPLEFGERLLPIRDAVLRSPAVLEIGIQAVARQPGVDSSRIALLGVSLGVPPAAAALRLTTVPRALVLVDGGADLGTQLRAGLVREGCPRWLAAPAAILAARLIRPVEPALNASAAAGRRVLILNAERDQFMPRRSIERLHAAFSGAEIRWRAEPHIGPEHLPEIGAVAREVEAWLASAGPPRAVTAPASRPHR